VSVIYAASGPSVVALAADGHTTNKQADGTRRLVANDAVKVTPLFGRFGVGAVGAESLTDMERFDVESWLAGKTEWALDRDNPNAPDPGFSSVREGRSTFAYILQRMERSVPTLPENAEQVCGMVGRALADRLTDTNVVARGIELSGRLPNAPRPEDLHITCLVAGFETDGEGRVLEFSISFAAYGDRAEISGLKQLNSTRSPSVVVRGPSVAGEAWFAEGRPVDLSDGETAATALDFVRRECQVAASRGDNFIGGRARCVRVTTEGAALLG
jgi:hypothetical protein